MVYVSNIRGTIERSSVKVDEVRSDSTICTCVDADSGKVYTKLACDLKTNGLMGYSHSRKTVSIMTKRDIMLAKSIEFDSTDLEYIPTISKFIMAYRNSSHIEDLRNGLLFTRRGDTLLEYIDAVKDTDMISVHDNKFHVVISWGDSYSTYIFNIRDRATLSKVLLMG